MATNAFYCPKCGKFTKHISISWREYTALMYFDTETQLLMGRGFDVLGGGATNVQNVEKLLHEILKEVLH